MTETEIREKIDDLARKRDLAADKYGKPTLAMTYQMEIDDLVKQLPQVNRK